MTYALGIDLGGTAIKVAVVREDGAMLRSARALTHAERGPEAVLDVMEELARRVVAEAAGASDQSLAGGIKKFAGLAELAGVGIGSPGPLSARRGVIHRMANLPSWDGFPLAARLRERLGLPVTLENDANVAALAEHWAGAGQGVDHLVMFTLGTGVGGGMIVDGRLITGHFENAGELGHMIVIPDGRPCGCGQRGCLETYASASAVAKQAEEAIEAGAASTLSQVRDGTGRVTSEDVAKAVEQGDALADRVWEGACRALATACINLTHTLNPELILFGGGLAKAGEMLLGRVRASMREQYWKLLDDLPRVEPARLGYEAGVIGAAGIVLRKF